MATRALRALLLLWLCAECWDRAVWSVSAYHTVELMRVLMWLCVVPLVSLSAEEWVREA